MSRPVVIIMVKAPRAGFVKTRLTPPLTADEAASLAACFAQDTARVARLSASEIIIAYAPADGRGALEAFLGGDLLWLEQQGADLGARLEKMAAQAFRLGFGPLIFIGADSPTLPSSYITQARDALVTATADIALGPTEDGGYYLVALRRPAPGLFRDIEWSTPRAFTQTARNAARMGLSLLTLPVWRDVDTPADLARLRAEILDDDDARRRAPATAEWLKRNMRDEKSRN